MNVGGNGCERGSVRRNLLVFPCKSGLIRDYIDSLEIPVQFVILATRSVAETALMIAGREILEEVV